MQHAEQVTVANRLFDYIDEQTTAMSDQVYAQPVAEYTDPQIAALEADVFFRNGPLCVGMSGLLPQAGTYAVHDFGERPLLLTRDQDGTFNAFLNVCRHRGARVAEGCGRQRSFVCPYHAWTYGLDGSLVARPEEAAFGGAPRAEHALTRLPAVERDGLLWVNPSPDRDLDLDRHLGGLDAELAAFGLGDFHLYDSRTLVRKMNWKLLIDTFLESYHFCVLHKNSICSIFYENLQTFDVWGPHFRLVSPRRTIETLRDQQHTDWNLLPHMVGIYVLFPNTVLVWQLDHVELWQVFPTSGAPDEGLVHMSLYTPEATATDSAARHWDNNVELVIHVVENEDFPVGEGAQSGFYANAQDHIVFGRNEPALRFFHEQISARLAAAR